MTPAERIRHLIHAGNVAPEEGERLLAALAPESVRSPAWIVVNPFDRFGGGAAALAGLLVSWLSVWSTRLGVRFDGFLDLHVAPHGHTPPLSLAVIDQVVAWVLPAACFWAYARVVARHARPVDFLGMVGLARLPLLVAGIPIALLTSSSPSLPLKLTPALAGIAVIALVSVAWNITLLYQGFKNASGLRGPKLIGGFIGVVVVAETISKLALAVASLG
jgi:hypothetical protein